MSAHDDELPSLDTADLARVTGGAGFDLSSMMPLMMMMMMRNRAQAAPVMMAPPPAPAPWQPTITVDGVPQQVTPGPNGSFTYSTPQTPIG